MKPLFVSSLTSLFFVYVLLLPSVYIFSHYVYRLVVTDVIYY